MLRVEKHQSAEQNVRRMRSELFALPQMFFFDASHDVFCEHSSINVKTFTNSIKKILTRIVVENGKLLGDFIETVGELFVVPIGENVVDATVFVEILLDSCEHGRYS